MAGKQGGAADGDDDGGAWPTTLRSLLYISSSTSSSLTDGPPVCLVCCVVFPGAGEKTDKTTGAKPLHRLPLCGVETVDYNIVQQFICIRLSLGHAVAKRGRFDCQHH